MIYYVNGEIGLDTNDGLTPESAFKTIQYAINIVDIYSNDEIFVEGIDSLSNNIIYNETLYLNYVLNNILDFTYPLMINHTSNNEIRYQVVKKNIIKISSNGAVIKSNSSNGNIIQNNTSISSTIFSGFEFDLSDNTVLLECKETSYQANIYFFDCKINFYKNGYLFIFRYPWLYGVFDNCIFELFDNIQTGCISNQVSNGYLLFSNISFLKNGFTFKMNELQTYSIYQIFYNWSDVDECVSNFNNYFALRNLEIKDLSFWRYCREFSMRNCIIDNFLDFAIGISGGTTVYIATLSNCILKNIFSHKLPSSAFNIKNCIFLKTDSEIFIDVSAGGRNKFLFFENCIFTGNKPVDIPEENFINCVFNTDPLLDLDFKPLINSPCLPQNWIGETPIDTFIGRYDYENTAPEIFSIYLASGSGDIPIAIGIIDSDSEVVEAQIQWKEVDSETWADCTIKYNNAKYGVAGSAEIVNQFLWDSKADIATDSQISIRCRVSDGEFWSAWVESNPVDIYNGSDIPDKRFNIPIQGKVVQKNIITGKVYRR